MTIDPYAAVSVPARFFLHRLNPLSKLAAPLPFMAVLLVVRDVWTPLLFLLFALVTILLGARLTFRQGADRGTDQGKESRIRFFLTIRGLSPYSLHYETPPNEWNRE